MSAPTSVAATVRVRPGQNVVTVIERFDVPAARQPEAVERATDPIVREWQRTPEFVSATLFRGRERGGVTCYAQWQPVDDAAPAEVPEAWSLGAALPTFARLDSRTYTVDFSDSATLPTQVSLGGTPLAHFGIFSVAPENQDRLLELAQANAPKSLITPGLVSINFPPESRRFTGRQLRDVDDVRAHALAPSAPRV